MKHKGFLFYQIAGNVALFLFGIIFAVSFVFDNRDVGSFVRVALEAFTK